MKVNFARNMGVNILLALSKLLGFLESRYFIYAFQISLAICVAFYVSQNRRQIDRLIGYYKSCINNVIWYKSLPEDYFARQERESQEIFLRYKEAMKPKPPKPNTSIVFPEVSSKSYIVMDVPSNTVLISKDSDALYPPASTAKLATALASLRIYNLDEEVAVPQFCTQIEGTKAEFLQGQKFIVSDLIKALLVHSSADASCVLSIGKSSYAEFIDLMNKEVKEAGLTSSKFTNPVGLDDSEGGNLSSAIDLARLGIAAMKNPFIKEAVKMRSYELKDVSGIYSKKLSNTNRLLEEIPGTVGIKTGTTTGAGEVLIYEYLKDKTDLIIVVMGSSDRFTDTKNILDWTIKSFTWE